MKNIKKIFILQGNPVKSGHCHDFAKQYVEGAREAGYEVKYVEISDLIFDPILHDGYNTIQELEPDLKMVQEYIKWSDHFVLFYPMWWSSMPALLKGMFDRMWLPGFGFQMHNQNIHIFEELKNFFFKGEKGWTPHLTGRTGRVFITMGNWPLVARVLFGDSTNEIERAILEFAGIRPTRIKTFGRVETMSEKRKVRIMQKMKKWGARAL